MSAPGVLKVPFFLFRVIYCTKLLMLARQLGLEDELVGKLQRVLLFIALIYVPAWLSATARDDAPVNDPLVLQSLLR